MLVGLTSAVLATGTCAAADPAALLPHSDNPALVVHAPRYVPPSVVSTPSVEQMNGSYPERARQRAVDGHVRLLCQIDASTQRLHGCKVIAEAPRGFGFGAAAIRIAKFYDLKPPTVDGKPVANALVQIPIGFRMALRPPPVRGRHVPALIEVPGPPPAPGGATVEPLAPPETTPPPRPAIRAPGLLWLPIGFLLFVLGAMPVALLWPGEKKMARKAGQFA